MALSDIFSNLQILIRWLHVLVGILWLGNLYLLDFLIAPLRSLADLQTEHTQNSALMLRALKWIRWAALSTVVLGVALLVVTYFYVPGTGFGPSGMFLDGRRMSSRALWIFFGMSVAMVMFFNVWFVAEPALKKLLLGLADSKEISFLRRRTVRSIRTTMILSGPMLFGMLAPAHYGAINFASVIAAMILGSLILWLFTRI